MRFVAGNGGNCRPIPWSWRAPAPPAPGSGVTEVKMKNTEYRSQNTIQKSEYRSQWPVVRSPFFKDSSVWFSGGALLYDAQWNIVSLEILVCAFRCSAWGR